MAKEKVKAAEQKEIRLTESEMKMTIVPMAKLRQHQVIVNEIVGALQGTIGYLTDKYELNPKEWQLSEDGTMLVRRELSTQGVPDGEPAGSKVN